MKAEIYKNGEKVATSAKSSSVIERRITLDGLGGLRCFMIQSVILERRPTLRILNGEPLSSFLNNSGLRVIRDDGTEENLEPSFYVVGSVEVFRGNPSIKKVVLAVPEAEINPRELAVRMYEVYRLFSEGK